jgi:hypothetical protein
VRPMVSPVPSAIVIWKISWQNETERRPHDGLALGAALCSRIKPASPAARRSPSHREGERDCKGTPAFSVKSRERRERERLHITSLKRRKEGVNALVRAIGA